MAQKALLFYDLEIYQIVLKEQLVFKAFERAIKTWRPEACPCRHCHVFIQNIGFL